MRMKKTVLVEEVDGVPALRAALEVVPDDAEYSFTTSWVGYGANERQETTGIEFTWTEDV